MANKYENVLVLGGTGFVGKNLELVRPDWWHIGTFAGTVDYRIYDDVHKLIDAYEPDAIVNLAAAVGGIKFNEDNSVAQYEDNILMNTNILMAARNLNVPRVLSALSTCVFPDTDSHNYPLSEEDLWLVKGRDYLGVSTIEPFEGHRGYGWSKRMLQLHTELCRELGYNYSTFTPSNVYGPREHIGEGSHFVAALIHKIHSTKDGDIVEFWGDGTAMRQQLFVTDLVEIIPELLEDHNDSKPIIVAPSENLTIKEMVDTMVKISGKDLKIQFNGKHVGQHRKDCESSYFDKMFPDFKFTSFKDGLTETYEWFKEL